jgi:hypothetical protein
VKLPRDVSGSDAVKAFKRLGIVLAQVPQFEKMK